MAGQLFKTLAVALSDRISEASSKMRTEVVAKNAKKQEQKTISGGQSTTLNVAKYRQLFVRRALEKLDPSADRIGLRRST